jgi:hypothetical protein
MQMFLLPGLVLSRFFQFRKNLFDKVLILFCTSLIFNYCFIFVLTLLRIYTRITLGILIAAELIAIVWLYREEFRTPIQGLLRSAQDGLSEVMSRFFPNSARENASGLSFFVVIFLLLLSVRSILWAVNIFVQNLLSVFSAWDAVVSWNHWAMLWAENQIPFESHFYPHLIPLNWSISYVLLGSTTLQFFAKGIMPLFTLMILLGFLSLAIQTQKYHFLVALVLMQLLLKNFLNNGLSNGYVDIAAAFFTFATVYTLIRAREIPEMGQRRQLYMLGALFSAGGAIAKQPGVYMALCFPVLVYADVVLSKLAVDKKQLWTWIAWFAAISFIWVSWYVLKEIQMLTSTERASMETLVHLSANRFNSTSIVGQIAAAIGQYREFVILFVLIALVFPWMDRFYKVLTLLFLPYPLLWAWLASYDTRNLAIFLPVLALIAGYAIDKLIVQILNASERVRSLRMPLYVPLALAFVSLLGLNFVASPGKLQQMQIDQQKQIFSPVKNQMLYDLVAANGPQTRILTNYPMKYLPNLEENQVRFDFDDFDIFLAHMKNPAIEYMLVPNSINQKVDDYIAGKINAGDYQVILKDKQWKVFTLIRILHRE